MDRLDQIFADREARRAAIEAENKLVAATALWRRAQEWPRCGQAWPKGTKEKAAEAVVSAWESQTGATRA